MFLLKKNTKKENNINSNYIRFKIKTLIDLSHQIAVKDTQFKLATFKIYFITLSCSTEYFLV